MSNMNLLNNDIYYYNEYFYQFFEVFKGIG